jgi:hypothetical protein
MGNAESVAHGFDVEELMRDSQCKYFALKLMPTDGYSALGLTNYTHHD